MSTAIGTEFPVDTTTETEGVLTLRRPDSLGVLFSLSGGPSVEITVNERSIWINLTPDVAEAFAHAVLVAARAARRAAR